MTLHAAVAATAVVVCGGQGARRARNWRHNRPTSPYNLARLASSGGLCPAQQAALEAQQRAVLEQAQQQAAQQAQQQSRDSDGDC